VLGIYPKGWTLPLVYRRDSEKHEIFVELRGLHRASELMPKRPGPPQPEPDDDPDKKDEPNPDDPDQPKKDQPKDDKRPGRPRLPIPFPMGPPAAEIPEAYKHLLEKKDGYANYYFNKLEQDRVLAALAEFETWKAVTARWKLSGVTAAGATFTLTLADTGIGLSLSDSPYFQSLEADSDPIDEPAGTGGLLIALHQLRILLTKGRDGFSDFYYLGSEPLDGRGDMVDVLISRKDGVETRWYFRKSDRAWMGFDSSLGIDLDPAEVRFLEFGALAGQQLPVKFQARSGEREFAVFNVETLDLAAGTN
jgi:hypothetical protein